MAANILNLPAYKVLRLEEIGNNYHISAETSEPTTHCIHCFSAGIVSFGRRQQVIRDVPTHGKRVGIYVNTQRYKCKDCSKTFYERLPDVDGKRLMTKRLVKWIGEQSLRQTFAHIADETGLDEKTVRLVFNDYTDSLSKEITFQTPQVLGIDAIYLNRRSRAVFTNIQHCRVIGMLADREKAAVSKYLTQMPHKDSIQYVTMDMWQPYKDAVETCLPGVPVVIDKFHVVKMVNTALDVIRKTIGSGLKLSAKRKLMKDRYLLLKRPRDLDEFQQLKLQTWLNGEPVLAKAYHAKEAFFDIYGAKTKAEALQMYQTWETALDTDLKLAFKPITTAFRNWQPHILTYFDSGFTNACTESANNLIRAMNRMGRGYSFEALRAKVLFTRHPAHRMVRNRFKRKDAPLMNRVGYFNLMISTQNEPDEYSLGIDPSILLQLIEIGKF